MQNQKSKVSEFENLLLELCDLCSQNREGLFYKIGVKQLKLIKMFEEYENMIFNQPNNGWISINDKLPEPEQEINYLDDDFEPKNFYLVQLKSGLIDTVYYATICDDGEYRSIFISCTVNVKENQYFAQERGFNEYHIDEVKYWQPMPKPPKE